MKRIIIGLIMSTLVSGFVSATKAEAQCGGYGSYAQYQGGGIVLGSNGYGIVVTYLPTLQRTVYVQPQPVVYSPPVVYRSDVYTPTYDYNYQPRPSYYGNCNYGGGQYYRQLAAYDNRRSVGWSNYHPLRSRRAFCR